jgi:hypothetical protein
MILLGVNCGFGNADVSRMPLSSLDLDGGWVNYPRPKTGVERRCPLWPETVNALRGAVAARPTPKSPKDISLVFVTKYGGSWHKDTHDNPIANEFRKLLDDLKLYRPGLSFYALRHTFETIGGESRDQVAVDYIMGHARDDMASVYRERMTDERLLAVTSHVHEWLFPAAKAKQPSPAPGRPKQRKPRRDSRRKSEGERGTVAPRSSSDSPGEPVPSRGGTENRGAVSCEQQERSTAVRITVGHESSEELNHIGVLVFSPATDSGWCYH